MITPTKPLIVAEIGINHNGSPELLDAMVRSAAANGADFVKVQTRNLDAVYTQAELDAPRKSPWGTTNLEQKAHLELTFKEYKLLDDLCKELNIGWFSSPWDVNSVAVLETFDCAYLKVASAMVTNRALLQAVGQSFLPAILSFGGMDLPSCRAAVKHMLAATEMAPSEKIACIMHCNMGYPVQPEDVNLSAIYSLHAFFEGKYKVGYSSHDVSMHAPIFAIAMGAAMVEVHFTLSREMYGSDQKVSFLPEELRNLTDARDLFCITRGDGTKIVREFEMPAIKKLRKVNDI